MSIIKGLGKFQCLFSPFFLNSIFRLLIFNVWFYSVIFAFCFVCHFCCWLLWISRFLPAPKFLKLLGA